MAQQWQADGLDMAEANASQTALVASLQRLSGSLRESANLCDGFVRAISRNNPAALAQILAAPGGSGANGSDLAALLGIKTGAPSDDDEGNDGGKKKSKGQRKPKDPNAPKRPPSAYILFQNEVREDMRQRHPELAYKEVLNKISDAWKSLQPEEKQIYMDKTNTEMERWETEKRDFIARTPAPDSIDDAYNAEAQLMREAVQQRERQQQQQQQAATPASPPAAASESTSFSSSKKRKDKDASSKKGKKSKR